MRKKHFIKKFVVASIVAVSFLTGASGNQSVVSAANSVKIEYTNDDIKVIPDKYNTGAKGQLTPVALGETIGNFEFVVGNNGTAHVVDFVYRNTQLSGTITFENRDFSNYTFNVFHDAVGDRKIKMVFNNCKFSSVNVGKGESTIQYEFNDCTFKSFYGGNSTLERCQFVGSYYDGMVPFRNVKVSNCFFGERTSDLASDKEIHTDGVQIYGAEGNDVVNVSFDNCRFEMPPIKNENARAYVNACIMLQMEYSNGNGMSFTDCILNGGGYSIYARSKFDSLTVENILFKNIRVGAAKKYGTFYSRMASDVVVDNVTETDSLYVGSVWKEGGKTHVSVSNDTNQERKLTIYTDKGNFEHVIPACPAGNQISETMKYAEFPFDKDITIDQDCEYVVCFDTTYETMTKQIRFVNWSNQDVYLDKDLTGSSQQNSVIFQGKCGDTVDFSLTSDGVLTLSGSGATYAYHSGKPAPWGDYASFIKEIHIEPGVEKLGNQLFTLCSSVQKVVISEGVKSIGGRTFAKCSCLTEVVLPSSLQKVGSSAFTNTVIQKVYYSGADWGQVQVEEGNSILYEKLVMTNPSAPMPTEAPTSNGTAAPSETQAPSETAAPSGNQAPSVTQAPSGTQTSSGTQTTSGTAAPSETARPSGTQASSGTQELSDKPEPSETPVENETPEPSETPMSSEKPMDSSDDISDDIQTETAEDEEADVKKMNVHEMNVHEDVQVLTLSNETKDLSKESKGQEETTKYGDVAIDESATEQKNGSIPIVVGTLSLGGCAAGVGFRIFRKYK